MSDVLSDIEHWTAEDREALVMTTLGGASELPVHEFVRRITKSYVPRRHLEGAVEALREIATRRPVVERNPDGDDQAAHAMQMVAREALAALPSQRLRGSGTVNPGCPSMHEPRGGPVRDETVTTRRTDEAEETVITAEQRVAELEAAIEAHREYVTTKSGMRGGSMDRALWSALGQGGPDPSKSGSEPQGAVDLLREARGWVNGHAETGWGAAGLVARIDALIADEPVRPMTAVIGHSKWCDRKAQPANLSGNYCSTCGQLVRLKVGKTEDETSLEAQLAEAVEALRFYADPATWDTISPRGTVTTNTVAKQDNGDRARRALGER